MKLKNLLTGMCFLALTTTYSNIFAVDFSSKIKDKDLVAQVRSTNTAVSGDLDAAISGADSKVRVCVYKDSKVSDSNDATLKGKDAKDLTNVNGTPVLELAKDALAKSGGSYAKFFYGRRNADGKIEVREVHVTQKGDSIITVAATVGVSDDNAPASLQDARDKVSAAQDGSAVKGVVKGLKDSKEVRICVYEGGKVSHSNDATLKGKDAKGITNVNGTPVLKIAEKALEKDGTFYYSREVEGKLDTRKVHTKRVGDMIVTVAATVGSVAIG